MDDVKKQLVNSILHFLRSEFHSEQGNADSQESIELAIQCLELVYNVKETVPNEPSLLEVYKNYLHSTGRLIRNVLTKEQLDEAERYKNQGNTAMSYSEFTKALEMYTKAIEIDPNNAVYYCNRAAAYSKIEDHHSAIADCKRALEIDPNYSKAYGRIGLAYYGLKNYQKAVDYYKKAIELDPTNEAFKNNYELALSKAQNQTSEASTSTAEEDVFVRNLNALFANPQLLNQATQMFSNPSMQNMVMTLIANSQSVQAPAGMDEFQNFGHRLAQHMRPDNPQSVNELIDTLNRTQLSQGSDNDPQHQQTTSNGDETILDETPPQLENDSDDN